MPVLIDGYNLYHYARSIYAEDGTDLSVSAFVSILDEWTARSRQKVKIIFDGTVPPELRQNSTRYGSLNLEFSGGGSDADTLIEIQVQKYSAPKLLTVVSSDRRIRKAAECRHCKIKTSDEFWRLVAKKLMSKSPARDPREKTGGLYSYEIEYWLKVFGLK